MNDLTLILMFFFAVLFGGTVGIVIMSLVFMGKKGDSDFPTSSRAQSVRAIKDNDGHWIEVSTHSGRVASLLIEECLRDYPTSLSVFLEWAEECKHLTTS